MKNPDVLVLGGGIIGLACARELALAGHRVEVVERLAAGAEASIAAAGMLAPLSEALSPGPLFEACRESRDLWLSFEAALEEETGLSVEHDTSGSYAIALDDEEEAGLRRLASLAADLGEAAEEVDAASLQHWMPGISSEVRRALRLPGDHRVDNVQACAVLKAAAVRCGVTVSYGREVQRVERRTGCVRVSGADWSREAGLLVLAAGAWSGGIAGDSGLPQLPVRPVRGQMLLLGGVEWPWKGSVRGPHFYAVRRGVTGLLVGATVEEAGFVPHPTAAGVESLLAFARRSFPGLGEARLETIWAGLRPGTPDGLPLIGYLPGWPVLAATGHFRNGILLAPWTGRQVASLVADGDAAGTTPDLAAFSPARFLRTA